MIEPGSVNMTHEPAKGFKETATDNLATLKRIRLQTWFLGIIAFGVILFLLVQARFMLISLVIAIILFSLTSDAIHSIAKVRIGGLRIPTTLASIVALGILTAGLVMLTLLVLSQANTVVHTVVQYTYPAQRVVAKLFSWMGANVEASMLQTLEEIQFGDYLRTAAGQASDLVQATILIILFVGFLFAERI